MQAQQTATPKTKCDAVLRVRVFALSADGRCALDALAQSEDACDLDTSALSVLAASLVEDSTESIDPHPKRCRVEVSLGKGGKGAPKSLNRDCPWAKRAANAADLAKSCAVRLSATPEKAPPLSKEIDSIIDGALGAMDSAEQVADGLKLLKALSVATPTASSTGDPSQLFEMVGPLLEDPRIKSILQKYSKG